MAGLRDWIAGIAGTVPNILTLAPDPPGTIDQMRSDLSHETASRVAFLSAMATEWRCGRFEGDDPARCMNVLADLRGTHRRYALLAFTCGRPWHELVAVLACIRALERVCRRLAASGAASTTAFSHFAADLNRFNDASARLVTALTACHAVGLSETVEGAVADVRADPGDRIDEPVGIDLETQDGLPNVWLAREHAARWRDVLRNLLRNAIEATRQQWSPADGACPPVRVVMQALPAARGVRVRIADLGVGMSAEQQARLWVAGASRHGSGRGQGLTEAKREFVATRAGMQVESAPGRGTTVTLDILPRDIVLPALRPWRQPAFQVGALVALLTVFAALPAFQRSGAAHAVDVVQSSVVRGLGPRGEVLWNRDIGARILRNDHLSTQGIIDLATYRESRGGNVREVLASCAHADGSPGHLTFLDGRGRIKATRDITWVAPRGEGPHELGSFWQVPITWKGGPERAYVVDVRKSNKSPESIQVVTARGGDFGAYHHPGQIKFFACEDFDTDGREEFLFFGINNDAWQDSLLTTCGRGAWHACAILLAPPPWQGQAYPYRGWDGVPAAAEDAYLLIPPLECGEVVQGAVTIVERASAPVPSPVCLLLRLQDGRILETDGRLRPISYDVGDVTVASQLAHAGHLPDLRVAYFHRGEVELIDVPRHGANDERRTAALDPDRR